jgi:hypothetical protein
MLLVENAESLGRSIGTKTDWFCLCLAGDAYNMNLEHPIFNTPFKVNPKLELKDTPETAFEYQGYFDQPIPKQFQMIKMQTIDYKNNKYFRIGMVSRPWGFTDSPDAEIISGGVSMKSPDAVAISRHGNFFHWGFSASPKYMTDDAKLIFINSVVYTAGLKGQKMIARKYNDRVSNKADIKFRVSLASKEEYDNYIASLKYRNEMMKKGKEEAQAKKDRGEDLTSNEKMFLEFSINEDYMTLEQYMQIQMGSDYEQYKDNLKGYKKYRTDNIPYTYFNGNELVIDEDAKSLKIANTDTKILDKAISMLEKGKDVDMARRILDRYTLCTFEKPSEWRAWFNKNKDKLFFTQCSTWAFMVNTTDANEPGNDYEAKPVYKAANAIVLPETSDREPVAIGATLTKLPGGRTAVVIKMSIRKGYHTYSTLIGDGAFIPTTIKVALPDGYSSDSIVYPATTMSQSGTPEYVNDIVFYQPLYGVGGDKIIVTVGYQCCDNTICFPPTEKTFELEPLYKASEE